MDKKSENVQLEMEKIKLERLKVYGNLLTVLITVTIGTFGVAYMNNAFQNRQLKQQQLQNDAELQLQQKKTDAEIQLQEKKTEAEVQLQQKQADAERRQAEMKYLGDFLNYALEDDAEKRLRFASYFAMLTVSPDLQKKWEEYYGVLQNLVIEAQKREEELRIAIETEQHEQVQELTAEIERLRLQLAALPKSPRKPPVYADTKNDFEDQGDVVLDHTTKLMWRKSDSEMFLPYAQAQTSIERLNKEKFAGYNDWRLPTYQELMTLFEPDVKVNGLHINPVFSANQQWCWSVTEGLPKTVSFVDFNSDGFMDTASSNSCVRAVRFLQ